MTGVFSPDPVVRLRPSTREPHQGASRQRLHPVVRPAAPPLHQARVQQVGILQPGPPKELDHVHEAARSAHQLTAHRHPPRPLKARVHHHRGPSTSHTASLRQAAGARISGDRDPLAAHRRLNPLLGLLGYHPRREQPAVRLPLARCQAPAPGARHQPPDPLIHLGGQGPALARGTG